MVEWIQANWAQLGVVGYTLLRFLESIVVLLKARQAISFINIIKEFFRIG